MVARRQVRSGGITAPALWAPLLRTALILAGLSPFVPLLSERWAALQPLDAVLATWFELQCHRDEGRALIGGSVWPVCARCWGIYVGLGLGALIARPRWLGRRLWLVLLPAAGFMLLDVLTEAVGLRPAWSELRAATGLLLGYPAAAGAVAALSSREAPDQNPTT